MPPPERTTRQVTPFAPPAAPPAPAPSAQRAWSAARYGKLAPPPPPRPAGPPLFLFEFSGDPIFNHPLWTELPNAIPSVRVEVRSQYDHDAKFHWVPARGPDDTVYGFMVLLARLMEGFRPYLRNRPFQWFGIPAGFGGFINQKEIDTYPNFQPLLNNPADRFKSGRRGPFFAEGLRRNRAFSEQFLTSLAGELARRKLPDPLAFIITSENGMGDDYAGHVGSPDTGWVAEALADPRATDPTQTIDGRRTFAQYMAEARTLEGGPVPEYRDRVSLGIPPGRAPINDESSERYRGALRLAWDWSREQAFSSIARAVFRRDPARPDRTVRIGEYQAACDSPWAPVRFRPHTLLHQMNGLFHTDLQCPDWYGGLPWLRTQDVFKHDDPGWETRENWLRVYPNDEPTEERRMRRLALDIHKSIASAHAASAPTRPLSPFVGTIDGMIEDDAVEYLSHCRQLGAWSACVFMPKADQANHDFWYRVIKRINA
jgi:hypothetical protein